ncbi:MAG: hypothetical protein NT175_06940 [Bacteroidetes bacterium]|nr:hypothetical protein [Bacteroidota bacterium]
MKNKTLYLVIQTALLMLVVFGSKSCKKDNVYTIWSDGIYRKSEIRKLQGFSEQRPDLLSSVGINVDEFITISTDSAWHLVETDRNKLLQVRNGVTAPVATTVLEKVIPLQDVPNYMNNIYGGTVGGFVSVAADLKSLSTMNDIYYGLRLDYPSTKFLPDGAGYAVIRFTSSNLNHLTIPYCTEMGGTYPHAWPNTGGGFTSSTLGDGGFPEYLFDNYFAPDQGGEIYEVTPLGNEILRATFQVNKWVTTEPEEKSKSQWVNPIRNGIFGRLNDTLYPLLTFVDGRKQISTNLDDVIDYTGNLFYVGTYAVYQNFTMRVWGYDEQHYLLTTSDDQVFSKLHLDFVERGVYGKVVSVEAVENLHEEINR